MIAPRDTMAVVADDQPLEKGGNGNTAQDVRETASGCCGAAILITLAALFALGLIAVLS